MAGKKAPANETKAQRFVRLANGRAAVAIKAIEGIGKLVGSQYESTSAQHEKLHKAILDKLTGATQSLAANKVSARVEGGIL